MKMQGEIICKGKGLTGDWQGDNQTVRGKPDEREGGRIRGEGGRIRGEGGRTRGAGGSKGRVRKLPQC